MSGILLSIQPGSIVAYIIGAVIIIAGAVVVVHNIRNKKGEKELETFLDDIANIVLKEIIDALTELDFKGIANNTSSLLDAEIELINQIYDKVWVLVESHLDNDYKDSALYSIVKANLTKANVEDLSEWIVNSEPVQKIIADKLSDSCDTDSADQLEKEYEELNKQIEDDTLADGEEVPEINLEEAMPDLEPIIPPSDDEAEIDDEIDEVVGEKTEEVETDNLVEAISAENEYE